jgi:hypothetical protein
MKLLVNGKESSPAPVTIVVAPLHEIPNLPPGYEEVSRWTDGTGTTTIRCWPHDRTRTRMELGWSR